MFIQTLCNGLASGMAYGLFALSFALIYSTTRILHFAHGVVYTTGGYLAYSASRFGGLDQIGAVCVGLAGASLLGAAIELSVYRPLRRAKASNLVFLLASLGVLITLQNTISLVFGDQAKMLQSGPAREGMKIFGATVTSTQVVTVLVALGVCLASYLILKFTSFGRSLRAVADDPGLARAVGVKTDTVILLVFLVGSGLAGAAGLLAGYDSDVTPFMGFNALLMGVVAAVIGGVGTVQGPLCGGLLVGSVQHWSALFLSTRWQYATVFLVLSVFLVLRPQGLFGRPAPRSSV